MVGLDKDSYLPIGEEVLTEYSFRICHKTLGYVVPSCYICTSLFWVGTYCICVCISHLHHLYDQCYASPTLLHHIVPFTNVKLPWTNLELSQ